MCPETVACLRQQAQRTNEQKLDDMRCTTECTTCLTRCVELVHAALHSAVLTSEHRLTMLPIEPTTLHRFPVRHNSIMLVVLSVA